MSWTKEQFVKEAFENIGYASSVYDLNGDQLESAGKKLDAMLGQWNGKGIRIGYPMTSEPENIDLSEETNVPEWANEAIHTNLSIRIAPSVGKTVPDDIKRIAREGYLTLMSRAVRKDPMQLPKTMPRGAGQKPWRYNNDPFIDSPSNKLATGDDDVLNVLAD